MIANVPFRVRNAVGVIVSEGERTHNGEVVVNRRDGERLFEYEGDQANGRWVERGGYAGADAHERGPEREAPPIPHCDEASPCPECNCDGCAKMPLSAAEERSPWRYSESAYVEAAARAIGGIGNTVPPRPTILDDAKAAVFGDRERDYGHPRDDFRRTATLWRAWLLAKHGVAVPLDGFDVSKMLRDVKDARLINNVTHRDSHTDIAGYAAAGARAVGVDE